MPGVTMNAAEAQPTSQTNSNHLPPPTKSHTQWGGFYKKSMGDRKDVLKHSMPHLNHAALDRGLSKAVADNMIENCIGIMGLPLGLGLNFRINNKDLVVPMCVEEPSVIAACSSAAKFVRDAGSGFKATSSDRNIMITQVQVLDCVDVQRAINTLSAKKQDIIDEANKYCKSMVKRGGGVVDVNIRSVPRRHSNRTNVAKEDCGYVKHCSAKERTVVVHLHVDVCEAMGANCCNAISEGVAPTLERLANGRVGLKILSNLSVERLVRAEFTVPVSALAHKGLTGEVLAQNIVDAVEFADCDPYRAATNNKGIMNGIDAVALATGQDWRALEAGAHAYSSYKYGRYAPLAWYTIRDDGMFHGEIELPIAVGTKGGAVRTNELYVYTHGLLGDPSAQELAMVTAVVGLAQNFAALRALASEGIQRGHMSLHARNIAVAAGASAGIVAELAAHMVRQNRIDVQCAKEYLEAQALHHGIKTHPPASVPVVSKKIHTAPTIFNMADNISLHHERNHHKRLFMKEILPASS